MDEGLFDDGAVIRRVAREGLLLAGGGRATLLQIAHPGVAQGVHDHSDFAQRPLDRLRTTMSYVFGVLFGTVEEGRAISRVVTTIHRKVAGPGYSADDPGLQVWVNATLYDTAVLLYQRIFGALTPAELDECYRQYSVLATSIGCPAGAWPADRDAFTAYWDHTVSTVRVSDQAREVAAALMRPRNIPVLLRPARPLNRLITAGLLPEPIRAQYGYSWSPARQRLFDGFFGTARLVYPRLPARLRDGVKDYYLHDLRRRLNRRRPRPVAGGR